MLKVTIHSIGSGTCALAQKQGDGLTVTFEDGTVREGFLTWKSFQQLCGMKAPKPTRPPLPAAVPTAQPSNGAGVPVAK